MIVRALKTLAAVTLLGCTSLANANLITNGDFEQDLGLSGTQWTIVQFIDGWQQDPASTGQGTGIEVQHNTIVSAFSGNQYVELDSNTNSTMYQQLSGLTVGQSYLLNFWYQPRTNNANDNGIDVFWGNTINDSVLHSIAGFSSGNTSGWQGYEFNLTASDENMFLGFAATGLDNSFGGFIDAVSVTRAVPEPLSTALFGLGLTALAVVRRRRR